MVVVVVDGMEVLVELKDDVDGTVVSVVVVVSVKFCLDVVIALVKVFIEIFV